MISLSLKPDRDTKYPSCFMEEKSVNGDPTRLTKFNATHIFLLGDETIETPLEDGIAAAPCVLASLLPAGHTGMQEGSTKGGAGVVSTK